jgi:hypothetical protein
MSARSSGLSVSKYSRHKPIMRRIEERFDALKKTLLIPADDALLVDGEYRTISSVGKSWFFSVCEWVAYISFILVVAGLIFRYYFA